MELLGTNVRLAYLRIDPVLGTNAAFIEGRLGVVLDANDSISEIVIEEVDGGATFIRRELVIQLVAA